jgi:hypothetical protein
MADQNKLGENDEVFEWEERAEGVPLMKHVIAGKCLTVLSSFIY